MIKPIRKLKALYNSIPDASVIAEKAKQIVTTLSAIAGGIIFIGFFYNSVFNTSVEIEPIKIPDSFAQRGYSSEIATTQILDEISKIREISTSNLKSKSVKAKLPGEDLSKLQSQPIVGGIDLNLIKSLIQTSLGIKTEKIISEITISEVNGKPKYFIRMRSNLNHKLLVDFSSEKDIPDLLKEVAIRLVEKIDPVAASSYYRWKKDYKNAFKFLDEALRDERLDDDLYALNNRASIFAQLKKFDLAQNDLNQVFEIDPSFAWSINVQSYLFNEQGRYKDALIWAKKAQKVLPDKWQPYANAGDSYKGLKDFQAAKNEYLKALELNPNWALQYLELIDFFSLINDEKNLERTYLMALKKFPRNSELLIRHSKYLIDKKMFEQALNSLNLAYREAPENKQIWDLYLKYEGVKDAEIEDEIRKKMKLN